MKIGLINWSGHKNLGDDAMVIVLTSALENMGHNVVNYGTNPVDDADCFIWGGGNLVKDEFCIPNFNLSKPVIGFGIGIDNEINEKNILQLKQCKIIFTRDIYSHIELLKHGFNSRLSFDPIFLIDWVKKEKTRKGTGINLIHSAHLRKINKDIIDKYKNDIDCSGFILRKDFDVKAYNGCNFEINTFDNAFNLLEYLSCLKKVIVTRLHAYILSYIANVPEIEIIEYDSKISRFKDYVINNNIKPELIKKILSSDLKNSLI